MLVVSGRIISWLLLLQEFNRAIIDKIIKANVMAYLWSRLNIFESDGLMKDSFLDERLFSISVKSPWFGDIANYLVRGKVSTYYAQGKNNFFYKGICII